MLRPFPAAAERERVREVEREAPDLVPLLVDLDLELLELLRDVFEPDDVFEPELDARERLVRFDFVPEPLRRLELFACVWAMPDSPLDGFLPTLLTHRLPRQSAAASARVVGCVSVRPRVQHLARGSVHSAR